MKIIALLSAILGLAFGTTSAISSISDCETCLSTSLSKVCAKTNDFSKEFMATKCCELGDTDTECTSDEYSCASGTKPLSYRYCDQPTECGEKDFHIFAEEGDTYEFQGTMVNGFQCAYQIGFPEYSDGEGGEKHRFEITPDGGARTDFLVTVRFFDGNEWLTTGTLAADTSVSKRD